MEEDGDEDGEEDDVMASGVDGTAEEETGGVVLARSVPVKPRRSARIAARMRATFQPRRSARIAARLMGGV